MQEGFSEGEKELKGLNRRELSSTLCRGTFSAVVFVVRWKDGVDRGKRGRCTPMQVCSCHREKVLSLLHFFTVQQKAHMRNRFFWQVSCYVL